MYLDISCKTGKLQITDDGILRNQGLFGGSPHWQVPCQNVTGFTTQPGTMMSLDITINTTQGIFQVGMVTKQNFEKLQSLFPHLQATIQVVPPKPKRSNTWYKDETLRAHVATYTKDKDMRREVDMVSRYGWIPQNTAAQGGHVSAAKMVAGAIIAGPVGILVGSGRSKDKLTITYVRSQEWLAQH